MTTNTMTNQERNIAFLNSLQDSTKEKIIAAIADHYATNKDAIVSELTLNEKAHHILDYMVEPERTRTLILMMRQGLFLDSPMTYIKNQYGIMFCTQHNVNAQLLTNATIMKDLEEAEKVQRGDMGLGDDDDVCFLGIYVIGDEVLAEDLDSQLYKVNSTIEQFINNYSI